MGSHYYGRSVDEVAKSLLRAESSRGADQVAARLRKKRLQVSTARLIGLAEAICENRIADDADVFVESAGGANFIGLRTGHANDAVHEAQTIAIDGFVKFDLPR